MSCKQSACTMALLFAGCAGAWAQRTPAPAASGGTISAIGTSPETRPDVNVETEQRQDISSVPASSARLPSMVREPQLWTSGVRIMQMGSKNPAQFAGFGGLQEMTMLSGNTALNRYWGRSQLQLNYNGAESILAGGGADTQVLSTQQASLSTTLATRRWSLSLSDAVSYAPQSSFGLGALAGLGANPDGFTAGMRSGYYPNESVLSSGKRLDNSTVAEIGYQLSQRNSLRASGGFGILRFQDSVLQDGWQYNLGLGFDRALSRRSNVSLSYRFFRTNTSSFNAQETHSVYLGYTRQLTSRLGVQISAGPELEISRVAGISNSLGWTTSNSLLYQMERTSLSLSYSAGTIGGSGIYGASRNHTAQAALSRKIARFWAASLSGGYAQNDGFGGGSILRTEYGGMTLGRREQGAGLSFTYQVQHQSVGGPCVGLACSVFNGWSHTFGVGLDWIFRPVRIG